MSDRVLTDHKEASTTQTQLDGLVVNIELTLISMIQGVAFSFLADRSRDVLVGLQLVSLPYAVTGLLIILLVWSRSLIHTLTVIRWPLDFAHNFMYIACTLVGASGRGLSLTASIILTASRGSYTSVG